MKKYYDILGLDEGASKEDIENKYKRLSKEFDPNNNDNQDFFKEEFKKIQDAYNVLTNNSILSNSDTNNSELNLKSDSEKTYDYDIVVEPIKEEVEENDFNLSEKQKMFSSPFSFDGRIRRTEYGISVIIFIFSFSFLNILAIQIPILILAYIPLYWFYWAQGAKRCHDRDNSGWFQIIPLYPLWMIFAESHEGMNRFGPNPKGIN